MIERRLLRQLEKAAGRFRHLHAVIGWSIVWILAAVVAVAALGMYRSVGWYSPWAAPLVGLSALVAALIVAVLAWRSARDYHWVALRVEEAYPELRAGLLAAISQQPQLRHGRYSYLQATVIQDTLHHAYVYTWKDVVPWSKLLTAHSAHLVALVAFVAAVGTLGLQARPQASVAAIAEDDIEYLRSDLPFDVTIEPGDTEIERGSSLLVLARCVGALPLEAHLVYGPGLASDDTLPQVPPTDAPTTTSTSSGSITNLPMTKTLKDPVYGGRIAEVNEALSYRVEFAGQATETYRVTVFEYPRLVRADATLNFPSYTGLETRVIQDVRRVSAVEGTRLQLNCQLNKQVASARLVSKQGEAIDLKLADKAGSLYATELLMATSQRYELELIDHEGRRSKQTTSFVITVIPNKPPDLKLVQPARDTRVSPIEELALQANVWDDFGVSRFGLAYSLGGLESQEIVLGESAPAKQRTLVEHLIAFEDLEAEPDQLLSYHFWAEDTGPDGQLRRVSSDMFFAEVRHFEEIFREGQSPPGGESPPQESSENEQAAEKLAELQKQIISGTWNVLRREQASKLTNKFVGDTQLLAESQADAIGQAETLAQELEDPQSRLHIQEVLRHMEQALTTLGEARDGPQLEALTPALAAEQAAYQTLLKLRAREHQVVQSRQQSSSSSSSSSAANRQQQELQQLELDSEENRYETERTANTQPEQAARENRQVLNRLAELARRQGDLNERLKELQSALEEAPTEEEREEILRQLKRLQEEQQQVLRDTEELQERMERPENQEQMAEAREQLDQTRENVRQASEALEEGRVSRALAAGSRAENELNELREEFRRRASGQFTEEMREMRDQARELDDTQQQLSERLTGLDDPKSQPASLRETGEREEIVTGLAEQTERLQELLDRMQETVLEAEETEPLLADQLYKAARDAQQRELGAGLNTTRRMLEYGFSEDAQRQEQQVRSGINDLREGVDRAAESVLGDETTSLRRAREALQELSEQLNNEIARAGGGSPRDAEDMEASTETAPNAGSPGNAQPSEEASTPGRSPSERGDAPSSSETANVPAESPGATPGDMPPSPGAESGRPTPGEPGGEQPSASQSPAGAQQQRGPGSPSAGSAGSTNSGGSREGFDRAFQGSGENTTTMAPIGGEDFVEWSDRLRDVEEMLSDPQLRAEAARIRDRARGFRVDLKRHSKEPSWDLVELQVAKPLAELRDRIAEELLRRTSDDATIPLDRDPVPSKYQEQVRRYYEQLGSGK